jgi:hypothetical protein
MDVVRKVERTKTRDRPEQDVVITDSGTLPVDAPFQTEKAEAK